MPELKLVILLSAGLLTVVCLCWLGRVRARPHARSEAWPAGRLPVDRRALRTALCNAAVGQTGRAGDHPAGVTLAHDAAVVPWQPDGQPNGGLQVGRAGPAGLAKALSDGRPVRPARQPAIIALPRCSYDLLGPA